MSASGGLTVGSSGITSSSGQLVLTGGAGGYGVTLANGLLRTPVGGSFSWQDDNGNMLLTLTPAGALTLRRADSVIGSEELRFQGQTTLYSGQNVASLVASWYNPIHSTRQAQLSLGVYGIAGGTETLQTALTITAQSSGVPSISLAGPTTVSGTSGNYLKLPSMTVANLTSASTAGFGATACVTDATATTVGSTVAAGGSNSVYVRSNGTNWIIF